MSHSPSGVSGLRGLALTPGAALVLSARSCLELLLETLTTGRNWQGRALGAVAGDQTLGLTRKFKALANGGRQRPCHPLATDPGLGLVDRARRRPQEG